MNIKDIDNLSSYIDNEICDIIGKPQKTNKKTTLVMSGGGIKGIAHVGAMGAMKELGILDSIDTIAGSSVGALIGFLYNIGYMPEELYDFALMFDFMKLKTINPTGFLNDFGLDSGKKFMMVLTKMVETKNINPEITFRELYKKTKMTLIVVGSCMNNKQAYYFSHKTAPDMPCLTAINISTAIPIYFMPIMYNNKMFIDGGCIDNYPIQLFADNINSVVGLYLMDTRNYIDKINNAEEFLINLIQCLFEGVTHNSVKGFEKFTISISVPGINMVNFELNDIKKKELYAYGYNATKKYFASLCKK